MKNIFLKFIFVAISFWPLLASAGPRQVARGNSSEECLYKKREPIKLPNAVVSAKGEDSTSFFLRGGVYLDIVEWSCSRLGKRILVVVPKAKDSSGFVYDLIVKIAGASVATEFKSLIRSSFELDDFSRSIEIQGFEAASYSVHRSDYEAIYTILYYTSD